jgi:hypothetical protein
LTKCRWRAEARKKRSRASGGDVIGGWIPMRGTPCEASWMNPDSHGAAANCSRSTPFVTGFRSA